MKFGLGTGRMVFEMDSPVRVQEFWQARSMGMTIKETAEAVGVSGPCAVRYLKRTGGMRPPAWKDPGRYLTRDERFRIKELLCEGVAVSKIARELGRDRSTIYREIKRGGGRSARFPKAYSPSAAHRVAYVNRRRPKPLKIPSNPQLLARVQQGLDEYHSPEQIMGRLRREFPDRKDMHVSHETIYKTIYLQGRGGLKRELKALTRTGRTIRHPKRKPDQRRGRMKDKASIWDRPAEALDRSIPGHWEGDLIMGKARESAIATVVERHSNFVILGWLDPSVNLVEGTTETLVRKLHELPDTLRSTLTWDQGKEMSKHRDISVAADIEIYFADPHSPWQRATNENTNGLLRQFFPKGTDLSVHSQDDLDYIADLMNRRPRKRLDFATPYEVLSEHLLQ